jgi:hypothetical protein
MANHHVKHILICDQPWPETMHGPLINIKFCLLRALKRCWQNDAKTVTTAFLASAPAKPVLVETMILTSISDGSSMVMFSFRWFLWKGLLDNWGNWLRPDNWISYSEIYMDEQLPLGHLLILSTHVWRPSIQYLLQLLIQKLFREIERTFRFWKYLDFNTDLGLSWCVWLWSNWRTKQQYDASSNYVENVAFTTASAH